MIAAASDLVELLKAAGGTFALSFLVALVHYDWPFNVRELESCIKRGAALAEGSILDTPHLPDAIANTMPTLWRDVVDGWPTVASMVTCGESELARRLGWTLAPQS